MTHLKRMRPLRLAAMILLLIVAVGLHAIGGLVLLNAGLAGFSLHNPIVYVLLGLALVVGLLKFKHLLAMMHRKANHSNPHDL